MYLNKKDLKRLDKLGHIIGLHSHSHSHRIEKLTLKKSKKKDYKKIFLYYQKY